MRASGKYYGFNTTQAATLERLIASAVAAVADNSASIMNLNDWAVALATKLNGDAGVTDTNYDINPQNVYV